MSAKKSSKPNTIPGEYEWHVFVLLALRLLSTFSLMCLFHLGWAACVSPKESVLDTSISVTSQFKNIARTQH